MNKDLTVGKPEVVLWKFAIPLFGSVIFQQMYNIADSLIAGRYAGENALAAVGNSYEITLIYLAFAFGCNIGCSVIVSQLFGAKKFSDMKTAVWTTLIASGILCVALMALGFLLGPLLLRLINTPENVFSDSLLYLNIYTAGLIFLFYYNIATGIFSAMGDSKTPFIFLAFSSVANIIMDYIFVKNFGMGVAGVAWATFICQGISCVLALITIFLRLSKIKTQGRIEKFSVPMFRNLAVIAIPSILQQSFVSVGNIILQSVINVYGSGVMAGYSAVIKLNNLVITSFTTLGNAMSNFTAQNIGAKKLERIKEGYRGGLILIYIICIPVIALYLLYGQDFMRFFMKEESAEAVATGVKFIRIVAPFYFVVGTKLMTDGILRGSGAMKQFMAATFMDLILRVILAYILSGQMGSVGIWYSWPVGWILGTALSLYFYLGGSWKKGLFRTGE
ncbi:MAG: MATE family efflux transporter [Alistipes sp.]|nr:MATE family efflux transporter [Alistipes sp.]